MKNEPLIMPWLTDAAGKIISVSSSWKAFIGNKETNGEIWYKALHPQDQKRCIKIFKNAFINHKPFKIEYRLRRPDGEYRYILDTGEPYTASNGKFSGYIGASIDITRQRQFELQLEDSREDMEQHNVEMRLINKLNSYLQVCRTLKETYPVTLYYVRALFPGCTGALYLLNESKTVVELVVSWGDRKEIQIPIISPDHCWALRQGKAHIVNDVNNGLDCMHLREQPSHGYTCTPIIAQGDILGMLHLQFINTDRRVESLQRLANMAADNLALALVSLKLRQELKRQSIRDPLTKLFNRRHMEEMIEREYSRCKRNNEVLGILMVDIDHFKSCNDNYGHDVGDKILCEIANLLQQKLRKSDIACRYGGEEFILILPGGALDGLIKRAEELRLAVKRLIVRYRDKTYKGFAISIGVAAFPIHAQSVSSLIKAADKALYQAKNTGRDKVVAAERDIKKTIKAI